MLLTMIVLSIVIQLKAIDIKNNTLQEKIDSLVSSMVDKNQPGGVIGIIQDNKTLVKSCYGQMDIENNRNIDENTIFDIASVSKQFTSYAILLLEREGKLNLDDDISKYLTQIPNYEHGITIRNLIQHTSGIASTDVLRLFSGLSLDEPWDHEKEMELIMRYPQVNFTPNSEYAYSNAGYSLLATIVESVSGLKFSDFLKEKVFKPLKMKKSFVFDNPKYESLDYTNGYKKDNDIFIKCSSNQDLSYGSGNIYSTMKDMLNWAQHILKNTNYLNKISTPYNTLTNGDTLMYTYGFEIKNYKGVKMVEHSGGVPGFRSRIVVFPEENLALVLMFNTESISTKKLALNITEMLFADKLVKPVPVEKVEIEVDSKELKHFVGNYQMTIGMEIEFKLKEDTFWLVLPGDEEFQLFAESPTKFFIKAFEAECTFIKNNNGDVNEMIWHQGGTDFKAVRTEKKVPLKPEELAQYSGKYFHKILNSEFSVEYQNEILTLKTTPNFKTYLGFEIINLNHINGDKFLTNELAVIEFTRNSNNQIDGFIIKDVGRLRNIVFSKY